MWIMNLKTKSSDFGGYKKYFMLMAIIFSVGCIVSTALHYGGVFPGNFFTWSTWLFSVGFLFLYAFETSSSKFDLTIFKSKRLILYVVLTCGFFITHLWNFSNLPWSDKGLFDDGAWDIYFAKNHIFTDQPFQAAFFDKVGLISREVVFHYYITFFFKLFGYNLLIFNIALTVLGYITFLFTTLMAEKLFNNKFVTIFAAVVLNFLPIHFMHMYAGHRYAIAAPMIMASLYFTYTGFSMKRRTRLVGGALLAALAVDSAVMGKQYLYGLILGSIIMAVFHWKEVMKGEILKRVLLYSVSLIICIMPLIMYVIFNPVYFEHEKKMTNEFISSLNIDTEEEGAVAYVKLPFALISSSLGLSEPTEQYKVYTDRFLKTFIYKETTGEKWFIPNFTAIPAAYWFLIIPGIIVALGRRYYHIVLLAVIPAAGAFIAGCADYRVLHGAPFWVLLIACAFSMSFRINDNHKLKKYKLGYIVLSLCIVVTLLGLYPSMRYIYKMASNPNSLQLLPHKDVEVARFMKDVAAGIDKPSTKMRWNELKTGLPVSSEYDTLLCQKTGYAITHLFLSDFDNKRIMSLSDQNPFNSLSEAAIFDINKRAVKDYDSTTKKGLKLIWEYDGKTYRIISAFKEFERYGRGEMISIKTDSGDVEFYVLDISSNNVDKFKSEVDKLSLK
ncbi:hypothetical protein [Pseudobacteroides sp.]|uniref:hypothetical protein n=1 Tax=Pseudobacteroides sp. TaxID=1968840 RepID=UPI002F937CFF